MTKPTIDEILTPQPKLRPRIYAYSIDDAAHKGLLKIGQTTREVKLWVGLSERFEIVRPVGAQLRSIEAGVAA